VQNCRARRCWQEASAAFGLPAARERVRAYNAANPLSKKGLALMPVCCGIAFTTTHLNQAAALVHVYTDGSVSVSTAAVEMGQGVNNKVLLVAARTLGVAQGRLRMESTCTRRVANTSPTSASTGADLNGRAAELACAEIRRRLLQVAAEKLALPDTTGLEIRQENVLRAGEKTGLAWEQLVQAAFFSRVNLSAQAHYAPPGLHFDRTTEKGEPFAYHVFGTALVEATVDGLRGTCTVDSVRAVHDAGSSLNPLVDRGQAEGGIVQGIGWMTLEDLVYSDKGRLLTDSLSTYKIPDIRTAPAEIDVRFLEDAPNPAAVLNSKAVGEPPFMYGIGAYYALLAALRAFRPRQPLPFSAPLTNEKILAWLEEK
ncbi:MAG TPA: molybdopterin cofactor-binding domain-containing protein, partial [Acidobacteriota bacterium]